MIYIKQFYKIFDINIMIIKMIIKNIHKNNLYLILIFYNIFQYVFLNFDNSKIFMTYN